MNVTEKGNTVIIHGVKQFDPIHIFECGQCFRWERQADGSYTGIAHGRVVNIAKSQNDVILKNTTLCEFTGIWRHYFDLDTDYGLIQDRLSQDAVLKDAVAFGSGIRILNQEVWECMLSFIISANNNIPRIKGIIKRFCEHFGEEVAFEGKVYYTFPKAERLRTISLKDLKPLRAGFRDTYILDAIHKVNGGEVAPERLRGALLEDARREVMKIKGIGPKVADCVLLFGAGLHRSFPVDVWVKRVMDTLYAQEIRGSSVSDFVSGKFGEYAGFAQQYLFYYIREAGGKYYG
jgi:N-glycosylase/DNA lyase